MSTGIVIPWIVIGKFVTSPKGRFLSPCTLDRKSTRLNSSHSQISYAVFCLKKKKIVRYFLSMEPDVKCKFQADFVAARFLQPAYQTRASDPYPHALQKPFRCRSDGSCCRSL